MSPPDALMFIVLYGIVLWLHRRLRRCEAAAARVHKAAGTWLGEWAEDAPPKCWGFLCKAGQLPNGDPCRLCAGGTQAPSYPNPDRPQTLVDPPKRVPKPTCGDCGSLRYPWCEHQA